MSMYQQTPQTSETAFLDLPDDVIKNLLSQPHSSRLEHTIMGRVCKKLRSLVHWKVNPQGMYHQAISRGYLNILKWLHAERYKINKILCSMIAQDYCENLDILEWLDENGYLVPVEELPRNQPYAHRNGVDTVPS